MRRLVHRLVLCVFALLGMSAATLAEAETTHPSTAPAPNTGYVTEVRLSAVTSGSGTYWLRTPPGYEPATACLARRGLSSQTVPSNSLGGRPLHSQTVPSNSFGDRPPLIIALHGTDDTAREAVEFWAARPMRIPAIIAAPQGGRGWADTDVPTIAAMLADLPRRVSFDDQRVLLAGFSAGGAMAFRALYVERASATAVAALANYLPPSITQGQIRARRDIPVFYAVGRDDINHERMRSGIDRLRAAGADVELYRPQIGHVLDPQVAAAALEFFFERCRRRVTDRVREASQIQDVGEAAGMLEAIVAQARWYEPSQVAAAEEALTRIQAAGRRDLDSARALIRAGRKPEAAPLLTTVHERYGSSRLGIEAGRLRNELMTDPTVARAETEQFARARAATAGALLAAAQRELAAARPAIAAESCRHILDMYPETPAAERARSLLATLQTRPAP